MSHDDHADGDNSTPTLPRALLDEAGTKPEDPDISGTTLDGRYRLLHRLGAGGMGIVYAAEHAKLGIRVAVKVLKREYCGSYDAHRRRFLREARSAATVRDPNVVQIMDFGQTEDDVVYFVMEYVEGRDLARLLEDARRLSWSRARDIVLQVASGLEIAHQHRIIHRDVKPSNCIVFDDVRMGQRDRVKVLDFGIAKVDDGKATLTLTGTNELFGTVAYMAPELVEGTPASAASDVYALGVMLFQVLTGRLPFEGATPLKVLTLHMTEEPPRPRSIEPTIPAAMEAIVLRCMAKAPGERFQRMADVMAALSAVGEDVASLPLEAQPPVILGRARSLAVARRRMTSFAAVGVLFIGLGGAAWIHASRSDEAPGPDAIVEQPAGAILVGDGLAIPAVEPPASGPAPIPALEGAKLEEHVPRAVTASPVSVSGVERRAGASSTSRTAPTMDDDEARMKALVRRRCGGPAAKGTTLSIKMPVGSAGKVLSVTVTGGSKALDGCVRELLRKQQLTRSSYRVLDLELAM